MQTMFWQAWCCSWQLGTTLVDEMTTAQTVWSSWSGSGIQFRSRGTLVGEQQGLCRCHACLQHCTVCWASFIGCHRGAAESGMYIYSVMLVLGRGVLPP